jgi:hypothetical protein
MLALALAAARSGKRQFRQWHRTNRVQSRYLRAAGNCMFGARCLINQQGMTSIEAASAC